MRVFACLPKSINFQEAVGRTIGLPFLWLLSLWQAKQSKSRTYTIINYEEHKLFVREIIRRVITDIIEHQTQNLRLRTPLHIGNIILE
jgi:hypothetical protein